MFHKQLISFNFAPINQKIVFFESIIIHNLFFNNYLRIFVKCLLRRSLPATLINFDEYTILTSLNWIIDFKLKSYRYLIVYSQMRNSYWNFIACFILYCRSFKRFTYNRHLYYCIFIEKIFISSF